MHFYDFNIGDYAKKTAHLTNEEDIAYRRALDMYYDTEKPLPITHGLATLSRRLRVSEIALQNVIQEFFPDGINKHADEKIAAYYSFLERQKANGKKGGRPKHKPTANPVVSQNSPVPSQPLPTTHLPLTSDSKAIAIGKPNCPHDEIINLYHSILTACPSIRDWTPARQSALRARWNESEERQNLDYWKGLFEYIAKVPFLTGKISSDGRKPFFASLDWIVKAENFAKIREGRYD